MNKTDLRIKKDIQRGCSNERIAKKLGRKLTVDLEERINKHRN